MEKLDKNKAEKINQDFENDKLKFKDGMNKYEALFHGMTGKEKHYDKKFIEEQYKDFSDIGYCSKELAGKMLDLFFSGGYNSETIVGTAKAVTLAVIAEAYEHALEYDLEEVKKKEKWT